MGNFLIDQRTQRQVILAEKEGLVADLERVNAQKSEIETKLAELGDFSAIEKELAEIQELIYQVGLETRPEQTDEELVEEESVAEETNRVI